MNAPHTSTSSVKLDPASYFGEAEDRDPPKAGSQAVRLLMENIVLNELDVESAFVELMARLKARDYAAYQDAIRMVREIPGLREAWQLIMVDVLLATSAAAMTAEDETFLAMLGALCRPRPVDGCELIVAAVIEDMGDKTIESARIRAIRDRITNHAQSS